jgi:rhodanese-related sulfurtransferase
MADAVPANLQCGRPKDPPQQPTWGPVIRTFAGVWEIGAEWVFKHRAQVHVIDVRERDEVKASPMPSLPEATVLPLSELRQHIDDVPRDKPIVLLCPAGARSAIAATILEKAGVAQVASLRGGILEWMALGLPSVTPP